MSWPSPGIAERDLPFEVEMLLPADAERAIQAVRSGIDGRIGVAAQEGVVRLHHAVRGDGVLDGDEGFGLRDLHFRKPRGAAGGIARLRHDGEERLLVVEDLPLRQRRLVGRRWSDVVAARHIGGRHNGDDAGIGGHGREIQAGQPSRRLGRKAQRDMKQARRLAQIVDVGRGALHLQRRGIMRDRLADDLERILRLVIVRDGLLNAEGFKPHGRPPPGAAGGCACLRRRRSPPAP